jgi:hypothetical protein
MKITAHSESHIVELDDGTKWKIFPGDLDVTLHWKPEIDVKLVRIDDDVSPQVSKYRRVFKSPSDIFQLFDPLRSLRNFSLSEWRQPLGVYTRFAARSGRMRAPLLPCNPHAGLTVSEPPRNAAAIRPQPFESRPLFPDRRENFSLLA